MSFANVAESRCMVKTDTWASWQTRSGAEFPNTACY